MHDILICEMPRLVISDGVVGCSSPAAAGGGSGRRATMAHFVTRVEHKLLTYAEALEFLLPRFESVEATRAYILTLPTHRDLGGTTLFEVEVSRRSVRPPPQ